jgi:hypothetical protein
VWDVTRSVLRDRPGWDMCVNDATL